MEQEKVWTKFLTERDKTVFAAGGFGAHMGFGKRPALLVIDVNYAFCDVAPMPILESIKRWPTSCGEVAWEAMPHIRALIDKFHEKGAPVIYTTSAKRSNNWSLGSWAWKQRPADGTPAPRPPTNVHGADIVAEIAPGAHDIVVTKTKPSGFFGTELASYLTLLGCDSLIVVGTTTSGCVRATTIDGFSLNYRIAIAEDGCFDRSEASHAISLCDMHAKYADVLKSEEILAYLDGLEEGMFKLPGA